MTIDVQLNNIEYTQQSGAVSDVSSNNAVSQPIDLTQANGAKDDVNINSTNSNNTDNQTKRTQNELNKAFETIFTSIGVTVKRDILLAVLQLRSGKTEEELLNVEDKEITGLVNDVKVYAEEASKIVKAEKTRAQKRGVTYNENEGFNKALLRVAHDYKMAEDFGIDVEKLRESRRKGNAESIGQRIARYYDFANKGKDWDTLSKEEKLSYIERYFTGHFKDNSVKQINDFNKLLINTPTEDQELFLQIAPKLLAGNRCQGALNVMNSQSTQEDKTNIAEQITYEYTLNLIATKDENGNYVLKENATELLVEAAKNQRKEAMDKNLAAANERADELFTEENIQRYNELKEKQAKGEELTEEESAFVIEYEYQATYRGSQMAGLANSEVIDDEEYITNTLAQMNSDAYEHANPVYRDVLETVNEYVENHPETLKMSVEEFKNIMDKATNGNFSALAENPDAAINAPVVSSAEAAPEVSVANASYSDGQFVNKSADDYKSSMERLNLLKENIRASEADEKTATNPISAEGKKRADFPSIENFLLSATMTDIDEYFAENPVKAMKEVLNSSTYTSYAYEKAMNTFSNMNPVMQIITIPSIHKGLSVKDAYKHMDVSTLDQIRGTSYATEKARQEILEKKEELLGNTACA